MYLGRQLIKSLYKILFVFIKKNDENESSLFLYAVTEGETWGKSLELAEFSFGFEEISSMSSKKNINIFLHIWPQTKIMQMLTKATAWSSSVWSDYFWKLKYATFPGFFPITKQEPVIWIE